MWQEYGWHQYRGTIKKEEHHFRLGPSNLFSGKPLAESTHLWGLKSLVHLFTLDFHVHFHPLLYFLGQNPSRQSN